MKLYCFKKTENTNIEIDELVSVEPRKHGLCAEHLAYAIETVLAEARPENRRDTFIESMSEIDSTRALLSYLPNEFDFSNENLFNRLAKLFTLSKNDFPSSCFAEEKTTSLSSSRIQQLILANKATNEQKIPVSFSNTNKIISIVEHTLATIIIFSHLAIRLERSSGLGTLLLYYPLTLMSTNVLNLISTPERIERELLPSALQRLRDSYQALVSTENWGSLFWLATLPTVLSQFQGLGAAAMPAFNVYLSETTPPQIEESVSRHTKSCFRLASEAIRKLSIFFSRQSNPNEFTVSPSTDERQPKAGPNLV